MVAIHLQPSPCVGRPRVPKSVQCATRASTTGLHCSSLAPPQTVEGNCVDLVCVFLDGEATRVGFFATQTLLSPNAAVLARLEGEGHRPVLRHDSHLCHCLIPSMCLGLAGIGAPVFGKPCSSTHWTCFSLGFKPLGNDFPTRCHICTQGHPMSVRAKSV